MSSAGVKPNSVGAKVMINIEGLLVRGDAELWDGTSAIDAERVQQATEFLLGVDKQHKSVRVGQLLSDRQVIEDNDRGLSQLLSMVGLCEWWPSSDLRTFVTPANSHPMESATFAKDKAGHIIANAREEVVGVVDHRPAQLCQAIIQGTLDTQHTDTLQEIIVGVPTSLANVEELQDMLKSTIGNNALFEDYADGGFEVLPLRGAGFHVVVAQLGELSVQTGRQFADQIEEFCF